MLAAVRIFFHAKVYRKAKCADIKFLVFFGHIFDEMVKSLSNTDRTIVMALESKIVIQDVEANHVVNVLEHHGVDFVKVLEGNKLVSSAEDGTLKLWDLTAQKCLYTIGQAYDAHPGLKSVFATLPDSTWVYGPLNAVHKSDVIALTMFKTWDPSRRVSTGAINTLQEIVDVTALTTLRDATLVIGDRDNTIALMDPLSHKHIGTIHKLSRKSREQHHPIEALIALSDGTIIAGTEGNIIKVWQ